MNQLIKVNQDAELLEFLFLALPDSKKTRVRQYLKNGCVSVNGQIRTQFNFFLRRGDEVRIESSKTRAVTSALQFHLEIIYEDKDIIVIHKPAGLLTIATEKIQRETAIFAVNDYLNKKAAKDFRGLEKERLEKRVFVVHRIDRDVSGLLLFAKNEKAKYKLQENWGQFSKEYDAIVEGCPEKLSGTITNYLAETKALKVYSSKHSNHPDAKRAITHYEVVKPGKQFSLLRIKLQTGRKHQIRVHMADLGHPISGDKNYGAKTNPAGRIALHASKLELQHPVLGRRMTFHCPLPPALERMVAAIR